MAERDVDICIVGAGSAGLSVAAGAAQMGARVVLIESGAMGGDCLNVGCVPSKALLAAAKLAHAPARAPAFGVELAATVDFARVHAHVHQVIAAIAPNDSVGRFTELGVDVIQARARFTGPHTLLAGDRRVAARWFVIATGSRPAIPEIAGLDGTPYLTNETIFALTVKPDHLIIVGGGPIGAELAQAFVRLGTAVTLIEATTLLAREDEAAAATIRDTLLAEGVRLCLQARITAISGTDGDIAVALANGRTVTGSHLLIAAGRQPQVSDLGLDLAQVAHGPAGITVDRRLRTTNRAILAIGDCRAGPQFTHAAGYDAGIAIQNMLFRLPAKTDYRTMPRVTYTDPELAQVGLTEAEARAAHPNLQVLTWPLHDNDRAQTERRTEGRVKVMVAGRKIVGATIVAQHAGELIQVWGHAVAGRLSLRDLASQIVAYPTVGEASKRAAGSAYTATLFESRTRWLVRTLLKLPF